MRELYHNDLMIQIFTIECKYSYLLSDGARIQAHTATKLVVQIVPLCTDLLTQHPAQQFTFESTNLIFKFFFVTWSDFLQRWQTMTY